MIPIHAKALIGLCIDEGLKQGVLKNRGEFEELLDYLDKYFDDTGKMTSGSLEIPNDLEEAARKYAHCPFTDDGGNFHEDAIDGTAYHDFIAGAKWKAEQDEKDLSEKIAAAYQLGLADKEKQMMKEAVEGVVFGNVYEHWVETGIDEKLSYLNPGDKVHIIIVKEDLL